MCEALDQLPSHGGLADAGNPGNKEGRGPCIKQADDVIQFALATVEFPDARKVSQRRDQLLFHVLGEVRSTKSGESPRTSNTPLSSM